MCGGPGGDAIFLGNGDDLGRGGSGDDNLWHGSGRVDLVAGVGEDYLETMLRFGDGSRVDGGAGADESYVWAVTVDDRRRLDVEGRIDLGSGGLTMRLGEREREAVLAGVERLRIPDGRWTVLGTAADEKFWGGDLRRDSVTVRARGGDDRVSGTPGDDLLDGGAGLGKVFETSGADRLVRFEVERRG